MSVVTVDYLPFDYVKYRQEVLPALRQAIEGDGNALHALLASATHFSLGVRSLSTVPLPDKVTQKLLTNSDIYGPYQFEGVVDAASLQRIKAGEPLNPWPYLANIIPSLKGRTFKDLGHYGQLLHFYLFYSLCCAPARPSWADNSPVFSSEELAERGMIRLGDPSHPILPHDEQVRDWEYYISGDKATQALWGMFEQAPSAEMAQQLHLTHNTSETPRALNFIRDFFYREMVTGFITPEETQYLLDHVQPHKKPPLPFIIDGCLDDGFSQNWIIDLNLIDPELQIPDKPKDDWEYTEYEGKWISNKVLFAHWMAVHPQEMAAFAEQRERHTNTYQGIWYLEEEILHRMRQAASRGWGMIKTYYD